MNMLTQTTLEELSRICRSERPNFSNTREISHGTIRDQLSHGQKLYQFDRSNSSIEVTVFCGFVNSLNNYPVAVVNRGENTHPSNLYVHTNLIRDILLSISSEYATECVFVSLASAERALRRYQKKAAEKLLLKLSEDKVTGESLKELKSLKVQAKDAGYKYGSRIDINETIVIPLAYEQADVRTEFLCGVDNAVEDRLS